MPAWAGRAAAAGARRRVRTAGSAAATSKQPLRDAGVPAGGAHVNRRGALEHAQGALPSSRIIGPFAEVVFFQGVH